MCLRLPSSSLPEELQSEIVNNNFPCNKYPRLLTLTRAAFLQGGLEAPYPILVMFTSLPLPGFLSGLASTILPESYIRGVATPIRPHVQKKYMSTDPYSPLMLVVPRGLTPPWRDCFTDGQRDIIHGGSILKDVVQNAKLKQCNRLVQAVLITWGYYQSWLVQAVLITRGYYRSWLVQAVLITRGHYRSWLVQAVLITWSYYQSWLVQAVLITWGYYQSWLVQAVLITWGYYQSWLVQAVLIIRGYYQSWLVQAVLITWGYYQSWLVQAVLITWGYYQPWLVQAVLITWGYYQSWLVQAVLITRGYYQS